MQLRVSNRLLPLIAIGSLSAVVLVAERACTRQPPPSPLLDTVPTVTTADADTPADTLATLMANVAAMTRELQALKAENTQLRSDNQSLQTDRSIIESNLAQRLDERIEALRPPVDANAEAAQAVRELQERLDAVTELLGQLDGGEDAELPIGFGFATDPEEPLVWIAPLDQPDGAANVLTRFDNEAAGEGVRTPVHTVPRNATLIGATALTAMLGRVPVRGEVRDPMPFKVLTGATNLAANGQRIEGIAGMVWSGTAIGDWTLGCVSGELHSVTFVFADGTVQTLSSDEPGSGGNNRRALGWISDDRGVPCVAGTRKTNAGQFLGQRLAVGTITAAADAAAAAQTTNVIRDTGAISSSVDGDIGDYVLGRSLADGANEVADWLAERQAQNFDAVFVPAGASLVIHVDQELPIDLDPNARKLRHVEQATATTHHRRSLD